MMSRNYWVCVGLGLLVFAFSASASVTDPNILIEAWTVNGTAPEPLVTVNGGMVEGAQIFVDRDALFYGNPGRFEGLDYVQTAMDDKVDADIEVKVGLRKAGTLFLIIDNRVGDNEASNPPTLGSGIMDWVGAMGFVPTPYEIGFNEPATVYSLAVGAEPNVITLGAQNNGSSRAMYAIMAAPEGWNFQPYVSGVPATALVASDEPGLVVDATVTDDDGPLPVTVQWTTVSAPEGATVTYTPSATVEDVTISFSDLGDYTVKLTAFDGEKTTEKTIDVTVQLPSFAIEADNWVEACNDSQRGPDAHYKPTSYMYVRNHSAPRRRIQFISYDVSGVKEAGKVFANSFLTLRRHSGHGGAVLSVYGVREDLDDFDLDTGRWNNLPGVKNTPAPPMADPITLASLDPADLSELLLEYGPNVPLGDAWSNSPTSAALDEFLNADTDGTVLLMFVTFSPEDSDFEIFCKGRDTANPDPETGLTGMILRGNMLAPTWATNPSPVIHSGQTTALNELSWTNPAGVGDITCNVYIGADEPNVLQADYGLDTLATGLSGNSVSLASYPLTGGMTYYWVVDVYDSGTGELTRGFVWSFDVLTNLAPTVSIADPIQYLWLGHAGDPTTATAVFDVTADDDGIMEPLTYLWEQIDGPVTISMDPNNVEDKTLILPETGDYTFKVTVFDGEHESFAGAQVSVRETPCDAAQAKPGFEFNAADFNEDCYVNIEDFGEFAEQWLDCHDYMDAPCN